MTENMKRKIIQPQAIAFGSALASFLYPKGDPLQTRLIGKNLFLPQKLRM